MMFHRSLCILAALANAPTGLTAGQLVKRVGEYGCRMSYTQIRKTVEHLLLDGYVYEEAVRYTSKINKRVYHIPEQTIIEFASICTDYAQMEKQLVMPMVNS